MKRIIIMEILEGIALLAEGIYKLISCGKKSAGNSENQTQTDKKK